MSGLFSVVSLMMGISSHFAQKYRGMDQLYSMEKIFQWDFNILLCWPSMVSIARSFSYRGMTPKRQTTKSLPNRLRMFGLFFLMILACEIHAIVLSFYPPKNWKDMISILCGSFVIAAAYYKLYHAKVATLPESTYNDLAIEKTLLTDDNHV
ncbi:hypothetical protein BGW37DRAFT_473765 [Umbelopsis sp. PMI_123]|nr:hypothetical protein BGW37DRAFT_473765 [Umbelopsis sp. PMI_123]